MKRFSFGFLLFVMFILMGFVGCKKSSNSNQITFAVTLSESGTLGQYLVDKDGYTLYMFADDYKGRNTCTADGTCAPQWPYFYAGPLTQTNLGNGLLLTDFDTIMVSGKPQTRYKGWPLYYYAPSVSGVYGSSNVREQPGQISGDAFQNIWFVAKPDYTVMLANGQLVGGDGISYLGNYLPGAGLTEYLTDPQGNTLYTFSQDSANINKFTSDDFSNNTIWPIFSTTTGATVVVPSILSPTMFTTTSVFGHTQLTFNGWPLYNYSGDNNLRGNTKGVSFVAAGQWRVPAPNMVVAP